MRRLYLYRDIWVNIELGALVQPNNIDCLLSYHQEQLSLPAIFPKH